MKYVSAEKWKWFGNAAHFICARWCRFHLATQVGSFIVSTVGEYVHPMNSQGSEIIEAEWLKENPLGAEIGCGRKFETMVFSTTDKLCDCGCGMPGIDFSELDGAGYNTRGDATTGHLKMCRKWAKKKPTPHPSQPEGEAEV